MHIKDIKRQHTEKLPETLMDNTMYRAKQNPGEIISRPGSKSYFRIGVSFDREGNIIVEDDTRIPK